MSSDRTDRKPLIRALEGETVTPAPVWLMRQAGRYLPEYRRLRRRAGSFLDLCYTPALAVEATLQPVSRFGLDAAIVFSDILVVADALGAEVGFRSGEGPRLRPVRSAGEVDALSSERLSTHLAPVYEAIAGTAAALDPKTALIGFAGAPWTLACYMVEGGASRDFMHTKTWAFDDPEGFGRLIEVLVDATARHLVGQVESGAEAVQIFDSWAGVLPATGFERWCIAPTRAVVERLRAACGAVPVIGFPRAAGLHYRSFAEGTGVDAVAIDGTVPAAWAARSLQPQWAVQGNLDPVHVVAGGKTMDAAATHILEALAGGPFVFNLGHGVLPKTPPENVARLVETVRAWRPRATARPA